LKYTLLNNHGLISNMGKRLLCFPKFVDWLLGLSSEHSWSENIGGFSPVVKTAVAWS